MALVVSSNIPSGNAIDVLLNTCVEITFNQAVVTGSVSSNTFVVYSQGTNTYRDARGTIIRQPGSLGGSADLDYVAGKIRFSNSNTTATFIPDEPFRPNVSYTVLLAGKDGSTRAEKKYISAVMGDYLVRSVKFSFTTGTSIADDAPVISHEIDYDDVLYQVGIAPTDLLEKPEIFPTDGSVNVQMVNDVLFTITSYNEIDTSTLSYNLYFVDMEDGQRKKLGVPTTYETEGGRILKIKFA